VLGTSKKSQDATKWFNRGVELLGQTEFEEALKCFDEAIRIDPKYAEAWLNRGFAVRGLGRFEEVLECFKKATEINPGYTEAWLNRGFALRGLERYEEALDCFDKVIKTDPTNADALAAKGFTLHRLNRIAEAARSYDEALKLNPSDSWTKERRRKLDEELKRLPSSSSSQLEQTAVIWFDKGNSLSAQGRLEEAIKCYEEATRIEPSYAESWYRKAVALQELGRFEDALQSYDEVIRIDPSFKSALEEIEIAKKKMQRKQPKLSATLLETVFKANLWKQTSLLIRNTGEAPLRKIKVEFLKRVEVGMLKEVESIDPGEELKLTFSMKPLESGDVPVEIRVTCKDDAGREHTATQTLLLKIIEERLQELPSPTSQAQTIDLSLQTTITVEKCIICNLPIERGEEILRCPSCGNKAHKTHMLEWLHVNKYCPACYALISQSTLEKVPTKESDSLTTN
jgi:tetratricopeptide (TPR) repeat protein